MKIVDMLRGAILRALLGPQAKYEGADRWSTRRSYIPGYVQDARFDADQMTRVEILRKARYWEANSAIVNRIVDLFEQYTVGPNGLVFVPATADEDWNTAATEFWDTWSRFPDIATRQNWGTLQSLIARSWAVDGEVFVQLTSGRERPDQPSYPRVAVIEAHRVETPPGADSRRIIDGIEVDGRGRPVRYWVRQGDPYSGEDYVPVEAENMVHVFEPSRPGMMRGLSMFYPVLNDLHDLDDLQLLTMDKAKDAASTMSVIKTKSGEMPAGNYFQTRFGITNTDVTGSSAGSSTNRESYYESVFRGRVKVLQRGDEYEEHKTESPSVAEREHWEWLISKVCAGFGVSKLLVFPHSLQGTVTRADLDVSSTFFRARSAVLASKLLEVYYFVLRAARNIDRRLADAPGDWTAVTIRPPRGVNVDVGRNSAALIAEYNAGWTTLEGICGDLGLDWRRVLKQRGRERAFARMVEQEEGLVPGELIAAALEALKQAAPPPEETPATSAEEDVADLEEDDDSANEPAKKKEEAT